MTSEGAFVLPGDSIDPDFIPSHPKKPLRLGPGLRHVPPNEILPTVSGKLYSDKKKNSMWVEYNGGRYTPTPNDLVLAQVHHSASDAYFCSLSPHTPHAILPHLAFENATKKTRPQLAPGALVYARVAAASRYMDVELECVHASTGKSDGLGPLVGGMVFDVSLGLARRLLMSRWEDSGVGVLHMLGEMGVVFEVAVGRNGRVWVKGESTRDVILVGRALQETDERDLGVEAQRGVVRRLVRGRGGGE